MLRLQNTWQTSAEWCFIVLPWGVCPVLCLEGNKKAQSTNSTTLTEWPQRQRFYASFWVLRMQHPTPTSALPCAAVAFSPSTFPMVCVDSQQSRGCRKRRQAQAKFYLPICTERTVRVPIPPQGSPHISCRLQSPSCSWAPDKTSGLSQQKPYPADLVRFGMVAHWESCTVTASCNSCMLLLSFGAFSLCLFGTWKV